MSTDTEACPPPTHLKCGSCQQTLPTTEFSKANTPRGYQSYCRPCAKAYHDANKQRAKACREAIKLERPFLTPVRNSGARAKDQGVPHDIDEQYLDDIWTGVCPVFKTKLTMPGQSNVKSAVFSDTQPSLDRLVPHKGYTRGNVVWISNKANMIKQQATAAEILAVGEWLRETEKEIERHEAD